MKLLICDRCGCTNKPFRGCLAAPIRGEIKDDGAEEVYSFHQVEGFDLCGPCFHVWWALHQNCLEIFLAQKGYSGVIKWEIKRKKEEEREWI